MEDYPLHFKKKQKQQIKGKRASNLKPNEVCIYEPEDMVLKVFSTDLNDEKAEGEEENSTKKRISII